MKFIRPFHVALPVRQFNQTCKFYRQILGASEGRRDRDKWQDFNLMGHQLVCHTVSDIHKPMELSATSIREKMLLSFYISQSIFKQIQTSLKPKDQIQKGAIHVADPSNNFLRFKIAETGKTPGQGHAQISLPSSNFKQSKSFYKEVLQLNQTVWQIDALTSRFILFGHFIAIRSSREGASHDHFSSVDSDQVPVPHFGVVISVQQFGSLSDQLLKRGVNFIVKPHIRFEGKPGAQWTMFFKDPSGFNLQFKAMLRPENLFAKYDVSE